MTTEEVPFAGLATTSALLSGMHVFRPMAQEILKAYRSKLAHLAYGLTHTPSVPALEGNPSSEPDTRKRPPRRRSGTESRRRPEAGGAVETGGWVRSSTER